MEFLVIAKSKRENFAATMTPDEQAIMGKHVEHVHQMFSEGKVVFAGHGPFGIYVFRAESPEAAQEMYENDPLVKAGIAITELHPFKVGLIENRK
ncbi:YciI family protein [Bacillus rhizoplanae]|uniref:YciI family protein n=1 Tax=Bacillus rhizoplanae TaxID=2880966 RepID=UPI003D2181D4